MAQLLHRDDPVVLDAPGSTSEAIHERPLLTGLLGQVLVLAAAAVLLLSGALTLARAGTAHLSTPIVSVFGFTHTGWLGIVELVVGAVFLIGGSSRATRDVATTFGILVMIAAILVLGDTRAVPYQLGVEHDYGWFVLAVGAAATMGGLLPGGTVRRWTRRVT